jgi:inner membrane protein
LTGAICSILPDVDVIGFGFGIKYGDLLGHRGLTHSIPFALFVSAVLTAFLRFNTRWVAVFLFLFLCTASHGILDAFTDGGLGVAFFSPFSNTRYFFPITPLRVSPIGLTSFFSGPFISVLVSEIIFIWIPCLGLYLFGKIRIED